MSAITEEEEENILYELLVYQEWSQDQDFLAKNVDNNNWAWKTITGYLQSASAAQYISEWVNQHLPWQFAVGAEGKAVAVIQDTLLEIRTSRDNYGSPVGKSYMAKDSFPQWRKLEWSPDGTLLACAHSNGSVEVFDLLASPLFLVAGKNPPSNPGQKSFPSNAAAGLVFLDTRTKDAHWSYELLVLDYHGQLSAYFVSPTQGYSPSHTFSFSSHLPYGITSVLADHKRNLLVVSSPVTTESWDTKSEQVSSPVFGLTVWRVIDDSPYYVQVALTGTNDRSVQKLSWLRPFSKQSNGNTIVKMSLESSQSSTLAAVHLSGAVSVWHLPTLKCRHFWPLKCQPGYDELNPTLLQLPAHRRIKSPALINPYRFHPVDVNWWSQHSLILARSSGAVSVCTVTDLRNKLGASAEFFDGPPRIGPAFGGLFLGFECEMHQHRKRMHAAAENGTSGDSADPMDDLVSSGDAPDDDSAGGSHGDQDDDSGILIKRMARSILYWATDSERFQPPRKRPKFVSRTYRLLGFKRTTPEELYLWKLDAEEYGEALALARCYGLDCDLVYQRQWRNTSATIPAIHDYLSKVSKRNWVLRECLERVPDDIDSARELLDYGLKNTDLHIVAGRKLPAEWTADDGLFTEEELLAMEAERRKQLLDSIDFDNLSVEQKMLISTRRRLLTYIDRLSIYEMILGGVHSAAERFEAGFFEKFRAESAFDSAVHFARQGDWQALATVFTFNGAQTLPHRLAICSCFPETVLPFEYRSVLPECDGVPGTAGSVFLWQQQSLRHDDWCETPEACRAGIDASADAEMEAVDAFYAENSKWIPFRCSGQMELTPELVSRWYCTRSSDIDKQSGLVEHAVDLIKLGLERNIPQLERIHHQLLTLETLVYDLQLTSMSLDKLDKTNESSIVQLFVSRCTMESFLSTYQRWLLPYLRRLDALEPGRKKELLHDLIVSKSQEDLNWTLMVVDNSGGDNLVVAEAADLISLVIDSIYSCQRSDQLEIAMKIYHCLPQRPSGGDSSARSKPTMLLQLHDRLDSLALHLEAADILDTHGVCMTPAAILAKQNDADQVEQLFIRLTRMAVTTNRTRPLTEHQWSQILDDMLRLRSQVFRCVSAQMCHEILVGSLLSCANKETIAWAGAMMQVTPAASSSRSNSSSSLPPPIPFVRSKQLVLDACREYFNSSENLTDSGLDLATQCLTLIPAPDEELQQEKDLISAVHLIAEYGLEMVPLKLRLSQNRLLLVDQVLNATGKAYKNAPRLLRLAHLLRACPPAELEGEVLVRIAGTALRKRDMDVAVHTCNRLRLANHSVGWSVCAQLASASAEGDSALDCLTEEELTAPLASFALTHCPPERIEPLLRLRWKLEQQALRRQSIRRMQMWMHFEDGEERILPLLDPHSVDAFRQLEQATPAPKKSAAAVAPPEANRNCDRYAQPVFYGDVRNLHESRSCSITYLNYSMLPASGNRIWLLSASRRISILTALQSGDPCSPLLHPELLLRLAEQTLPDDCLMALGTLADADACGGSWCVWARLPSTELTLQLAVYYLALELIRTGRIPAGLTSTPARSVLTVVPRSLVDHCLADGVRSDSMERALALLADVAEAQQLRRLDSGVDIQRFASDDGYKRDTIVGLAITSDPAVYASALRLADHYAVPRWQVAFSHLTALFADDVAPPERIRNIIGGSDLMEILIQDASALGARMMQVIHPSISGTDHARLRLFFEILNQDPRLASSSALEAPVHLRMLHQLESLPPVDVKKLTCGSAEFLAEIRNVLDSGNVEAFASLSKIAGATPAAVYCAWTEKYFFSDASSAARSSKEWMERFESCRKNWMTKLGSPELLQLVDGLCFSEQALDTLTPQIRHDICIRCLKLVERRCSKQPADRSGRKTSWDKCLESLRRSGWHLERLKSGQFDEFRRQMDACGAAHLWRMFERSRCDEKALRMLLVRVLVEQHPLSVMRVLIGVFPPEFSMTVEDVLMETMRSVLQFIRCGSSSSNAELFADCDPVTLLRHLLAEARAVVAPEGLIAEAEIDEELQNFFHDDGVDVNVRLNMLHVVPEGFRAVTDSDGGRIRLLHTLSIVQKAWAQEPGVMAWARTLQEGNVGSEPERMQVFEYLLGVCAESAHLDSLTELLHIWPAFTCDTGSVPWIALWTAILRLESSAPTDFLELALRALTLALQQTPAVSHNVVGAMYDLTEDSFYKTRLRLHIALKSGTQHGLEHVVDSLCALSQVDKCDYDDDILDLIVQHNLVAVMAATPLYGAVCERLLTLSGRPDFRGRVRAVTEQLRQSGYYMEAGHLVQMTSSVPRCLSNWNCAAYFARSEDSNVSN